MCGLLTGWSASGFSDEGILLEALKKLRHRGPDAYDRVLLENDQLFMSHVRLKIIDNSEEANQPFSSLCGRYTLVYNGEIYNFKALRTELDGHWEWRTNSDTEVLLAAWSCWGKASLQRFVGMFAFVVYDSYEQTITVVRDRFGIKPLYYTTLDTEWFFSSEIPPLLSMQDNVRANDSTIRTYLETGLYNHSNNTFFDNINAVEPGSYIHINLKTGKWDTTSWYNLSENIPDLSGLTEQDIIDGAEKCINEAIKSHLVADVEVGLNVSGGVDSSMLVRVALEELGSAHLFNQDYDGYSELPWVEQIADGGELHVARLEFQDIDKWLLPTIRSQAEPFGGVSVCGYNDLYQLASDQGVTVLLDGNGVDEIFLGYKRYHQLYVHSSLTDDEFKKRRSDYVKFWQDEPALPSTGQSIDGTSGLRPSVITKQLASAPLLEIPNLNEFQDPVRQAAAEDLLFAKIPRGLRFNDRVSMFHSKELRVPFLDHRLVEYAFAIPSEMLMSHRGGKSLFRDLLAKRVPESVAYAPKRSVQSPQREWLAADWRPLVESVLGSETFFNRGWVDRTLAFEAYQDYLDGNNENSFFIWQWLNLELWAREFLDKIQ